MTDQALTVENLKTSGVATANQDAPMSFLTGAGFTQLLRVSNMLSSSTMVPIAYRKFKEIKEYGQVVGYEENPAAIANCAVALNMAQRMNADPLMIMQNLHIIEGRPSWSSPFIIASINNCGRYSSLRFVLGVPGEIEEVAYTVTEWVASQGSSKKSPREITKTIKVRHQTCMAWAIERETGERLESPVVSIQMALDEGWLTKKGSKWQTIPELMLRYRCASFFGRLYAPELLMGLQSREEVEDYIDAAPDAQGHFTVNLSDLQNQPAPQIPEPEVNTETGEIKEPTKKARQSKPKPEPVSEPEVVEEPEQTTMLQDIEEADASNLPQFD